jgi:hypothetical protein
MAEAMVLSRVIYELYESEVEEIDARSASSELGRQLRLEFDDGSKIHVAWTWDDVTEGYYVEFKATTFCTDAPEVERDVSRWPAWSPLVGQSVELKYRDAKHQVVEIRSQNGVVFCCSYGSGHWGMDVLHVSASLPVGLEMMNR